MKLNLDLNDDDSAEQITVTPNDEEILNLSKDNSSKTYICIGNHMLSLEMATKEDMKKWMSLVLPLKETDVNAVLKAMGKVKKVDLSILEDKQKVFDFVVNFHYNRIFMNTGPVGLNDTNRNN